MGSSNESKAAIVLVCLVILLGLILVCVFLRCCYRQIKKRQQNDREESQIKSHVIQMALFNATTTSMQPFVVIYITISIFPSVPPSDQGKLYTGKEGLAFSFLKCAAGEMGILLHDKL